MSPSESEQAESNSRGATHAARLAAIVESSSDAIIGLTPQGTVSSWNPAAERLYGYTAGEACGRPMIDLVPAELQGIQRRLLGRALDGERISNLDVVRLTRTGKRLVVSLSLAPVVDDGVVVGLAAVERDVTMQRALEAQFLQAKRMEAVGRLAGGVAQEFNNIHTAILGLTEFMAGALPADAAVRSDLTEVASLAMRGSRLTRNLLAFSGRQGASATSVVVDELMRALEPLIRRLVSEQISVTFELASDASTVLIDESQLELVLFELVLNAADAVNGAGRISIRTACRTVDETAIPSPAGVPSGAYVTLSVTDSGAGMSTQDRSSAFEPFYTTKGAGAHLGLGLAMVYGVVRQFNGYVVLSEQPHGGTDVTVFVPLSAIDAPCRPTPLSDLAGSETLLVVEDDIQVRDVVCRGLRAQGYHVLEAKNGEDAMIVVADYGAPIHLVVSDVVMPHMDGRALFEHLRTWYPSIRFLFISGYTRGTVAFTDAPESPTGFLAKPFTAEQLGHEVARLLDRPRGQTP